MTQTEGRCHDLQDILDRCLAQPRLAPALGVTICWYGRRKIVKKVIKTSMAWYHKGDQAIRVNRILDQDWVPEYVLVDLVSHELLHHLLGWERDPHHLAFRLAEAALPWHKAAAWWIEANIDRLLGRRAS